MAPLPQPVTIARALPQDPSVSYAKLREEAIRLVQRSSGGVWTDYNEHDPGVTILEQLCYALTEIGYRAGLPIEDLLLGEEGLLPGPAQAYPTEPVTAADWRRLLIDRVRGLGNAWVEPLQASDGLPTGLYYLSLYAAPPLPGVHEGWRPDEHIRERATRAFVRHRALCEDVAAVNLLRPARTHVRMRVEIDPCARPEAVMAAIVQRLACALAPEPRRRSLGHQLESGLPLEDIFDGPRVGRGFIDRADLGERRSSVEPEELREQISALPDVRAVGTPRLWVHGREYRPGERCTLPDGEYFSLDSGLERSEPSIELIVRGRQQEVEAREALRRLKALWAEHRRTYNIGAEAHRLLSPKPGRARDLDSWTPVLDQFPRVYAVGRNRPASDAPAERRAQAKQLTAYVMILEEAMKRSLACLRSLAPLLRGERPEGCEVTADERNRLLDYLLALRGEAPDSTIVLPPGCTGGRATELRIEVKRRLLAGEGGLRKSRGRGLDYRARRWRRRGSGVELRSRIMLAAEEWVPRRWRPRLTMVEHGLLRPRLDEARPTFFRVEPMTVTAIVHIPGRDLRDRHYRHRIERMIRANTPAHVALEVRFVDREQWVRFRRLHKLWRRALRDDLREAADLLAEEMLARFDRWHEEEQA
jgi:hypothetical protein